MARATITIVDDDNGTDCEVRLEFDPPINDGLTLTGAQTNALLLIEALPRLTGSEIVNSKLLTPEGEEQS